MLLDSEKPKLPVYRVGNGVRPPVLIWKVEPEYSEEARKAKLQGSMMFYVQISPSGKPTAMKVVKSLGLGLDQKATEAAKRWRFTPGMKDGEPVTVEATIEVNFKLLP
jgi:TonB family protein